MVSGNGKPPEKSTNAEGVKLVGMVLLALSALGVALGGVAGAPYICGAAIVFIFFLAMSV